MFTGRVPKGLMRWAVRPESEAMVMVVVVIRSYLITRCPLLKYHSVFIVPLRSAMMN